MLANYLAITRLVVVARLQNVCFSVRDNQSPHKGCRIYKKKTVEKKLLLINILHLQRFVSVTTFKPDEKWTKFSPKCFGKDPV